MVLLQLPLVMLISLGSAAFAAPLNCEGVFKSQQSAIHHTITQDALRELAKLRVEAEENPSLEMQKFLTKLFETKLKEIMQDRRDIPRLRESLLQLIEIERAARSQHEQKPDPRLTSENEILNTNKLKSLHTYKTPILISDFGNFAGSSARGNILNSGNPPDILYSGEGVLFSRNEKFAMLRSKHVSGQSSQTLLFDLKERKQLKYSPTKGFLSSTSDYFAEVHGNDLIRVVDVQTEKVIGTAVGDPLMPDSMTFTNHFIITATQQRNTPVDYTLNFFKGGTLNLGKAFAVGNNGRILYVQDNQLRCINGRTLKEIPLPAELQNLKGTPIAGYSGKMMFETENDTYTIFAENLLFFKSSEFGTPSLFENRYLVWSENTLAPPKTQVYDLKRHRQIQVNGYFFDFKRAAKTLIFHSKDHQETILLNTNSFKAESVPGEWHTLTPDGRYLYTHARPEEKTKVFSMQNHAEQSFQIPGRVVYLPRHQQWIVTFDHPEYQSREHLVVESPESMDFSQVISDSVNFGISSSGRYLTVGVQGHVHLIELADPAELP